MVLFVFMCLVAACQLVLWCTARGNIEHLVYNRGLVRLVYLAGIRELMDLGSQQYDLNDVLSQMQLRRREALKSLGPLALAVLIGWLIPWWWMGPLVPALAAAGWEPLRERRNRRFRRSSTGLRRTPPQALSEVVARVLAGGLAWCGFVLLYEKDAHLDLGRIGSGVSPVWSVIVRAIGAFVMLGLGMSVLRLGQRLAARFRKPMFEVRADASTLLYLRSFEDERVGVNTWRVHDPLRAWLWPRVRFEEFVSYSVSGSNRFITIGRPRTLARGLERWLPPMGAGRGYYDHDKWREAVFLTARRAGGVVLVLGCTASLRDEMSFVQEAGILNKCLFVVPPVAAKEVSSRIEMLADALSLTSDERHRISTLGRSLLDAEVGELDARSVVALQVLSSGRITWYRAEGRDWAAYHVALSAFQASIGKLRESTPEGRAWASHVSAMDAYQRAAASAGVSEETLDLISQVSATMDDGGERAIAITEELGVHIAPFRVSLSMESTMAKQAIGAFDRDFRDHLASIGIEPPAHGRARVRRPNAIGRASRLAAKARSLASNGDPDAALALLDSELDSRLDNPSLGQLLLLDSKARILTEVGRPQDAVPLLQSLSSQAETLPWVWLSKTEALSGGELAWRCLSEAREIQEAERDTLGEWTTSKRMLEVAHTLQDRRRRLDALWHCSVAECRLGLLTDAENHLRDIMHVSAQVADISMTASAMLLLADQVLPPSRITFAADLARSAQAVFADLGEASLEADARKTAKRLSEAETAMTPNRPMGADCRATASEPAPASTMVEPAGKAATVAPATHNSQDSISSNGVRWLKTDTTDRRPTIASPQPSRLRSQASASSHARRTTDTTQSERNPRPPDDEEMSLSQILVAFGSVIGGTIGLAIAGPGVIVAFSLATPIVNVLPAGASGPRIIVTLVVVGLLQLLVIAIARLLEDGWVVAAISGLFLGIVWIVGNLFHVGLGFDPWWTLIVVAICQSITLRILESILQSLRLLVTGGRKVIAGVAALAALMVRRR